MEKVKSKSRTKPKDRDSKQALINAGIHEVSEFGISGLRITRLVERASTTTGAIQYHFDSREGLLVAVLEEVMNRFSSSVMVLKPKGSIEDRLSGVKKLVLLPGSLRLYKVMINLAVGSRSSATLNKSINKLMKSQVQAFERMWLTLFSDFKADQDVLLEIGYHLRMSIWGACIESEYHGKSFFKKSLDRNIQSTLSSLKEIME